jgi:UDP-glucuronate 4-epimerase
MYALVTGCAGFIGSHLTESLLEDGHAVIGVDCLNDNYGRRQKLRNLERALDWDDFDFVPIDLARGDLADLVEAVDAVFHLAAEPGVRSSWGDRFEQYIRNNVLATQHLLEAAKEWPEKRFVFASSSSIYGQSDAFPTHEETIPSPFSPYGVTKLAGEHLCGLYHGNYGVETVALRYFSVYGPRQRPDMAFNIFCRAALEGRPVEIYGDGKQTRDFTFVSDVVDATRRAGELPGLGGGVFNIGGGSRVSLHSVIALLEQITGRELERVELESRIGDVRDTGADIGAAREALGFRPQVELRAGLRLEWEWVVSESAREQSSVR